MRAQGVTRISSEKGETTEVGIRCAVTTGASGLQGFFNRHKVWIGDGAAALLTRLQAKLMPRPRRRTNLSALKPSQKLQV